jgi:oligoribonuclease (3'-5' exoribonuclease)
MAQNIDFWTLLRLTQEYVSQHYAAALTDKEKLSQLKSYIEKYLRDKEYTVDGNSLHQLTDRLYCEMAEYSVLTQYLGSDQLEEINSATRS